MNLNRGFPDTSSSLKIKNYGSDVGSNAAGAFVKALS